MGNDMSNIIDYRDMLYKLGVKSFKQKTSVKEEKMLKLLICWDNEVSNKLDEHIIN